MNASDVPVFMKILMALGELYDKAISKQLTDIYWETLKGFELIDVERAFQAHIHNPDGGQFFPKPADIVRLISGSGEARALSAWTKVEQAMVRVGIYQSLIFDDPIIHAVLEDMGGWIKLCAAKFDELPFLSREFQKRYMSWVNKPLQRYPKSCLGLIETDNAKNGYPLPAPLLIGNPKKAEQVMLAGGGNMLGICVSSTEVMKQLLGQSPGSELKESDEIAL